MSKITIDRQVLEQALEYLKLQKKYGPAMAYGNTTIDEAIDAMKKVLVADFVSDFVEQQAQHDPVAWVELLREARDNCRASIVEDGISASRKEYRIDLEARLTAAVNGSSAARKPLTKKQVLNLIAHLGWVLDKQEESDMIHLTRAIEAAHGIK